MSVGLTCTGGRTVTHRADPAAPGGVAIVGADLTAPEPGSVEAVLPAGLCAVDLRPARDAGVTGRPDRIRIMDNYQPAPIVDAYDLMISIPEVTPTSQVADGAASKG